MGAKELTKDDLRRAVNEIIKFLDDNQIKYLSELQNFLLNKSHTQQFGKEYIIVTKSEFSKNYNIKFISTRKYGELVNVNVNCSVKNATVSIHSNFNLEDLGYTKYEKEKDVFGRWLQHKYLGFAEIPEIKQELNSLDDYLSKDS